MVEAYVKPPGPIQEAEGRSLGFYIPAVTSFPERHPQVLKHGDTFAVLDRYGDVVPGGGSADGLYHNDTRYLSRLELLLYGQRPLLLGSAIQDNNVVLRVDFTNADIFYEGAIAVRRDHIHVLRTKFLYRGSCYERLAVRNFDLQPHSIRLTFTFAADFADVFEVRGHKRPRHGRREEHKLNDGLVALKYFGLDGIERCTTLRFDPPPTVLSESAATYDLVIEPHDSIPLFVTVSCTEAGEAAGRSDYVSAATATRRWLRNASAKAASVTTSNDILNEALRRSIADLYTLVSDTPYGPYPYAGIPWFSTAFGRDGIITAIEMLWADPSIASGVLKFLAATQAQSEDPQVDAEPGKIMHEMRRGEMARLKEVPFGMYYGSIDSTPLFVILAGMYLDRTGDAATVRALWPNVQAALRWIDGYGDRDGDGFVEYTRRSGRGLENQAWKDSDDAISHADGRLAEPPIACCEVQGYVYAAKRAGAALARRFGYPEQAEALEQSAAALAKRFDAAFWCEELRTYALALDGRKQPCRVAASNAGHLLFTGILTPERARRTADTLVGASSFCGWGIRTLASTEARYNPMSYHNGSVWPHDNALIALGMARYGLCGHAQKVFDAIFAAAAYMDLRRLPELFCGFRRQIGQAPTFYPVACSPQAWASGALFAMLQASLGMSFDYPTETVRLNQPYLPKLLEDVVIRNIAIGATRMDLMLHRHGSEVSVNVLAKHGEGRVEIAL
jgi:glycogen debranching enzyme